MSEFPYTAFIGRRIHWWERIWMAIWPRARRRYHAELRRSIAEIVRNPDAPVLFEDANRR